MEDAVVNFYLRVTIDDVPNGFNTQLRQMLFYR